MKRRRDAHDGSAGLDRSPVAPSASSAAPTPTPSCRGSCVRGVRHQPARRRAATSSTPPSS